MSLCGQSPLFVPTTVNAVIKNIDAVDVAATNLSCKTFSIDGKPVSGIWANIDSETAGTTKFTGNIEATGTVAAADFYVKDNPTSGGFYLDAFHSEFEDRTGQITRYTNGDGNKGTRIGNSIYYVDGDTSTHDPEAGVTNCSFKLTGPGDTVALFADIGTNNSSGNTGTNRIGIKTTTPAYDLDVNGSLGTKGSTTIESTTTHPEIVFKGTSSQYGLIQFKDSSSSTKAAIYSSSNAMHVDVQSLTDGLSIASYGTPLITIGTDGSMVQSSGTSILKATTMDSVTTSGDITQSGGTATLNATTVNSLTINKTGDGAVLLKFNTERPWQFKQIGTGGGSAICLQPEADGKYFHIQNINGIPFCSFYSHITTPLVSMACPLSVAGNITQSSGTATLKATTVDSLTTAGAIVADSVGANSFNFYSNPLYPIIASGVTTLSTPTATIQVFASNIPIWVKRVTILAQNVGLSASTYGGIVPKVNDAWGTASGSGVTIEESLWGNNGASSLGGSSTIMGLWNTAGYTLGAPARTRYVIEKFDNNTWFYQVTTGTGQYACIGQGYFTISTVQTAATTAASTNSTTITIAANNVLGVGWVVTGTGITGTVTVTAKPSSTSVTVNTAVTIANGTTLTFTAPSGELQNFRFQTVAVANYTAGMKVRGYYE